jgi:hypothetical protein
MKVTVNIKLSYASGSRKSWWKHVTSVDASKKGGYAFEGDFLHEGECEIPIGAVLLEVAPGGSVKNPSSYGQLFSVEKDGSLSEITSSMDWRKESVSLRKAAEAKFSNRVPESSAPEPALDADVTAQLATYTTEQLAAELLRRQ